MNERVRPEEADSEDLAGRLISSHCSPERFTPRRISSKAAATIDQWVALLATDDMSLAALPLPLFSLYNLGVMDGIAQREHEVRAAKLDADRLWLRAFGEPGRQEYLLERLDHAADLANRPDVDDVLDEAWRMFLASLDHVREPIQLMKCENSGSSRDAA